MKRMLESSGRAVTVGAVGASLFLLPLENTWAQHISQALAVVAGLLAAVRYLGRGLGEERWLFFALVFASVVASLQLVTRGTASPYGTLITIVVLLACAGILLASAGFLTAAKPLAAALLLTLGVLIGIQHSLAPAAVAQVVHVPAVETWGPFVNRNNFAMFAELVVPLGFAMATISKRPYIWLLGSVILTGSVLAAGSRAGSVIILLEWLCYAILYISRQRGSMLRGLACMAGLGIAVPCLFDMSTLSDRLLAKDSASPRMSIAAGALPLVAQKPLQGYGLGSFEALYPLGAKTDLGARVDHAHNDWLEWSVEGGIWLPAVFIAAFFLSLRRASVWALVGVGSLLLHSLVDYPFHRPGLTLFCFAMVPILLSTRPARENLGKERCRFAD